MALRAALDRLRSDFSQASYNSLYGNEAPAMAFAAPGDNNSNACKALDIACRRLVELALQEGGVPESALPRTWEELVQLMPQLLQYREEATRRSTRHAPGVRLLYEIVSWLAYLSDLQQLVLQQDNWSGIASSDAGQLQRIAVTYAADRFVLQQQAQQLLLELGYHRVSVVTLYTIRGSQVGLAVMTYPGRPLSCSDVELLSFTHPIKSQWSTALALRVALLGTSNH